MKTKASPGHTNMIFQEDKYVDGVLTFKAKQVVEVADGSVARWKKRGGQVVDEEVATTEETATVKQENKKGK